VLQLVAATLVWFYAVNVSADGLTSAKLAGIVSLSAGALFANVVSVVILVAETVMLRR
jgi:hypothetical protein